jgi:DnaA family protein
MTVHAPRQLTFELLEDAPPSFANFLPGSNTEAVAHLAAFARGELAEKSVLLWGAPGSGKSHLVAAVLAAAPGALVGVETGESAEAGDALPASVPDAAASNGVVAVEDVDRLGEAGQARLFTIFNECRRRGIRLLTTARVPPAEAPLRDDLRTRLGWGLVLELKALGDAEKPAALAAYAAGHGFRLSPDVVGFLLSHLRRDMGTLLAMVRALDRYSLATKRPITVPLVRELLQPGLVLDSGRGPDEAR